MKEIIGVRFRPNGKIYFFSPGDHDVECGQARVPNGRGRAWC